MNRRTAQSAFTLLEVILAMAVTCMIAVSMYASLRTAFYARDSATSAVSPVRNAQIALEMIGHDLQSALPPGNSANLANPMIGPFYGQTGGSGAQSSDTIEFYAVTGGVDDDSDPTRADGIKKFDIDVETLADGTSALVRNVAPSLVDIEDPTPVQEILCRNVASVEFQYFDGTTWADTWDSTAENNVLPAAVQVTLEMNPEPGKLAPGYRMTQTFLLPCSTPAATAGATQ